MALAATTNLHEIRSNGEKRRVPQNQMQKRGESSIPEGVEVDPGGGAGAGVGGHEDGGGEGEAEGGEAEGEDQGVEAAELLDGDGGVEVGVGGSGRSSSAVAEAVRRGRHGRRGRGVMRVEKEEISWVF